MRVFLAQFNIVVADTSAEVVRRIEQGLKKNVNICSLESTICSGNLGLKRDKMPQIEAEVSPAEALASADPEERAKGAAMVAAGADAASKVPVMQSFLNKLKVRVKSRSIPVGMLKATQKEISGAKAAQMAKKYLAGQFDAIADDILVSRDGFILDGHHRWAALLLVDHLHDMSVQVVDLDMAALLLEAQAMPGVYAVDLDGTPLDASGQQAFKTMKKTASRARMTNQMSDAARQARTRQILRVASRNENIRMFLHGVLQHLDHDRKVRALLR